MFDLLAHDTGIWVAISFLLFVVVAYKLGAKSVIGGIDGKIEEIKNEIQQAESLRVEAQELLAQYQRKQRDAEKEAADIIARAKANADKIRQATEAQLTEQADRREAQLTERLQRLEENAIADIQNHAAKLAVQATKEIIAKTLDDKTAERLGDEAITDLSRTLN